MTAPDFVPTDTVRAAAMWTKGDRCPWNGCPSICIHAMGYALTDSTPLVCDACDTEWTVEAAKAELARRSEAQLEFARIVTRGFGVPDRLVGTATPWWRALWQRITRRPVPPSFDPDA